MISGLGDSVERELLPLSGLQHLLFCERQCALIHVEQQWRENRLTAEGRELHERVDGGGCETRGEVRTLRAVALVSTRLGLSGKADVVEVEQRGNGSPVFRPVEYKRGKPKSGAYDLVQLCAQALCLEEMTGTRVVEGALFYGRPRRRQTVQIDDELRALTEQTVSRFHQLINSRMTPPAIREPKCDRCSLIEICLPGLGQRRSARSYLEDARTLPGDTLA